MSNTLTGTQIRVSYTQILHIPNGVEAAEKPVRTGGGIPTVFNLGSGSASFDNVQFAGNTISTKDTNGNLILAPNGTGSVQIARIAVTGGTVTGLSNLTATGGTLTGVTFSGIIGSLSAPLSIANGGTGGTTSGGARTALGLGTIATQDANNVAITGGTIAGVPLPFNDISGKAYAGFYSSVDQTASVNTATAVRFEGTYSATNISVANDGGGNPTRITFALAGTYKVTYRLQLQNTDVANVSMRTWLRLNGTDVANTSSISNAPKAADGGLRVVTVSFIVTVTANQYIEVMWATPDADLTLHHDNALASPYVAPAVPSAAISIHREA